MIPEGTHESLIPFFEVIEETKNQPNATEIKVDLGLFGQISVWFTLKEGIEEPKKGFGGIFALPIVKTIELFWTALNVAAFEEDGEIPEELEMFLHLVDLLQAQVGRRGVEVLESRFKTAGNPEQFKPTKN